MCVNPALLCVLIQHHEVWDAALLRVGIRHCCILSYSNY